MRIAIGVDHHGVALKKALIGALTTLNGQIIEWVDYGCNSTDSCDYPVYALPVCQAILAGDVDYGILSCGSGVGMAIAANRFAYIYAALVWDEQTARLSKEHDNANVLVLPADFITHEEAVRMVQAWLNATFLGERHQRRLALIDALP